MSAVVTAIVECCMCARVCDASELERRGWDMPPPPDDAAVCFVCNVWRFAPEERADLDCLVHFARAYQPWLAHVVSLQNRVAEITDNELPTTEDDGIIVWADALRMERRRLQRELAELEHEHTARDAFGALRVSA